MNEQDKMDSKDIYLMNPKTGEIVGLHAVGYAGPYEYDEVALDGKVTRKKSDFQVMEQWGNPYDKFLNFTGNSFRVFEQLEKCAMEFINDGWVDLDTAKVLEFTGLTVELLKHKILYHEKKAPVIADMVYDAKEREWLKLGTEIGIPMEEYPCWRSEFRPKDRNSYYQNHKLFWRAKQLADEKQVDHAQNN